MSDDLQTTTALAADISVSVALAASTHLMWIPLKGYDTPQQTLVKPRQRYAQAVRFQGEHKHTVAEHCFKATPVQVLSHVDAECVGESCV